MASHPHYRDDLEPADEPADEQAAAPVQQPASAASLSAPALASSALPAPASASTERKRPPPRDASLRARFSLGEGNVERAHLRSLGVPDPASPGHMGNADDDDDEDVYIPGTPDLTEAESAGAADGDM
jgi:hypothetical protein